MKIEFKKILPLIGASLVLTAASSIISGVLASQSSTITAEAEALVLPYNTFKYDYRITGLNDKQFEDFKNSQNVEKVAPYKETLYRLTINGERVEESFLYAADLIEYTPFCSERIVEKIDDVKNGIYVDYSFAKRYHLGLGDSITHKDNELIITRIYQTYDNSLAYNPNMKFSAPYNDATYQGIFVKAKYLDRFEHEFLEDYKPLGELRAQREGESDVEYQAYVDAFMAKDYSSSITSKNKGKESAVSSSSAMIKAAESKMMLAVLIPSIIMAINLLIIVLIPLKKIRYEVSKQGNLKGARTRYLFTDILSIVFYFVIFLPLLFGLDKGIYYIAGSAVLAKSVLAMILPPIIGLVMTILTIIIINASFTKSKKAKVAEKAEEKEK